MASRAENDLDLLLLKEIPRPHYVIDILDLVIDVLNAWFGRREKRDLMMNVFHSQKRTSTDPIAHSDIEKGCPKCLIPRWIS